MGLFTGIYRAEIVNFVSIVMIPGLLCTDDLYCDQIAALAGHPVRIADTTRDASVTAMAERLLADAPDKFALCGLSMGGYVALEVLRLAPERVLAAALMATSHRADTPGQTAMRHKLIDTAREQGIEAVARLLCQRLVAPETTSATLRERIVRMAAAIGVEGFVRQQQAIIDRPDQSDRLPTIDVPVTVVAGEADAIIPPERAREMAAAIPGARLEMLPATGHMVTIERPDRTSEILRRSLAEAAAG
ncbi:alpha/beta fold hydrolase [Aurantimonas coralicida]|uniref:alpha/beta fold hydrolase n=1 Tax=Aurantimonas coralicida TaxID=182270 RepID=UPI002387781B|nr:alpha/beta fold hydrolase [Aurantimonas coralicida]MDE0923876.1 alpha/beta fold hydrolase [Aurantimonas coralicida]